MAKNLAFDPTVQEHANGPLTSAFKERVVAVKEKHKLTYWDIAQWAGFSGSFLGNAIRYKDLNMGTTTATRLAQVIARLEAVSPEGDLAGIFAVKEPENAPPPVLTPNVAPQADTIEYAIATLRKNGLGVILIAGGSISVTATTANP